MNCPLKFLCSHRPRKRGGRFVVCVQYVSMSSAILSVNRIEIVRIMFSIILGFVVFVLFCFSISPGKTQPQNVLRGFRLWRVVCMHCQSCRVQHILEQFVVLELRRIGVWRLCPGGDRDSRIRPVKLSPCIAN